MILIIYTDGDSGLFNPYFNIKYDEFVNGTYEYALVFNDKKDIEYFAENWYNRVYKQSDKFFDVTVDIIPDIINALHNEIDDKFEIGNYYFKTIKQMNLYFVTT